MRAIWRAVFEFSEQSAEESESTEHLHKRYFIGW